MCVYKCIGTIHLRCAQGADNVIGASFLRKSSEGFRRIAFFRILSSMKTVYEHNLRGNVVSGFFRFVTHITGYIGAKNVL